MVLQAYLVGKFKNWQPPAPEVVNRTKSDITLRWAHLEPFSFIADFFLYKIEKNNKIPPWVVVYSGGKTSKTIDNLAPRHPHRFRLKVILKATAVPLLADNAVKFYGNMSSVYGQFNEIDMNVREDEYKYINVNINGIGDTVFETKELLEGKSSATKPLDGHKWLESSWSDETWTNTDTDGTSAVCFSMAVRCGYVKQVQAMLEERPELIGIINSSNGFTPLAVAVRKGDINTVRVLLSAGADINQPSSTGQTPLHLAVLSGKISIVKLLLENGADRKVRDWNGLQAEHYAVESCSLDMLKLILDNGDVHSEDNNGWTPLFRAICQGAATEIIEELVIRGSNVEAKDRAGLPLTSVARLLKNRQY